MLRPDLDTPKLVLSPVQIDFVTASLESLITALSGAGFLGAELGIIDGYHCFDYGDHYLDLISYLGCSPAVNSQHDDGETTENFISIGQFEEIQFGYSSPVPPARCPHCQKTDKNWPGYLQRWQQDKSLNEQCPHCGLAFQFSDMKWRKNGGYGRLLVQIHGIQEQLAVPTPTMINQLESITGTPWHYFFAESHD